VAKIDIKTRNLFLKRLRKVALKLESEILPQVWTAVLAKNKHPKFTISKDIQKEFKTELVKLCLFFFKAGYQCKPIKVRESLKVQVDDETLKAMQTAYMNKSKVYTDWFMNVATKLTNKRFKDTVTRAEIIVTEGIEQGLTRNQMRSLMAEKFETYNEYELDRVITTEGTRSMNLGTIAGTSDDDNVIGYRWAINYTGCPICDARQAETQGDGYIRKEDLTPDDVPPAHPNCNCSLEPVFKGDE
jgi:hypothetical protein